MEGSPRHKDEAALSTEHGLELQLLNLLEKRLKVYQKCYFLPQVRRTGLSVQHSSTQMRRGSL